MKPSEIYGSGCRAPAWVIAILAGLLLIAAVAIGVFVQREIQVQRRANR